MHEPSAACLAERLCELPKQEGELLAERAKIEEEKKQEAEASKKDLEEVRKMEEEERLRREQEDQPTRSISGRASD